MRLGFVALVLVLWAYIPAEATLCVCATGGDDSRSKATVAASFNGTTNTCSSPWATIGRAAWGSTNRAAPDTAEAADAGDTVYVCAGAYTTTGTNSRFTPAFNPANSGSSGHPITFVAASGVTVSYTSSGGPVIGAYQRDYIVWRGWSLDEATTAAVSDTGLVVLWESTGSTIEYCTLDGNGDPGFGSGELHNAIRLNAGGSHTIRENTIHDVRGTSAGANASGILLDHTAGGTIEHNRIYDSDGGIFDKRNYTSEGAWVVRYNHIHDTTYGIRFDQLTDTTPADVQLIHQNLLVNVTYPFMTNHYVSYETYDLKIVNNTVVGGAGCIVFFDGPELTASADHLVWNNIITGCDLGYRSQDTSWTSAQLDAQHNIYYDVTNAATWDYEQGGQTTINWATWVALPQDDESPASLTSSDPLFVNTAGGDYRLCTAVGVPHASCSGASPALSLGRVTEGIGGSNGATIPAGACITGTEVLGLSASGMSCAAAGATGPVRLRIRGEEPE